MGRCPDALSGIRAASPHRCSSLHTRSTPEGIMYYLGIDVHRDDSPVAVLDDDGEIVDKARVQNANLESIAEEYAAHRRRLKYWLLLHNLRHTGRTS